MTDELRKELENKTSTQLSRSESNTILNNVLKSRVETGKKRKLNIEILASGGLVAAFLVILFIFQPSPKTDVAEVDQIIQNYFEREVELEDMQTEIYALTKLDSF